MKIFSITSGLQRLDDYIKSTGGKTLPELSNDIKTGLAHCQGHLKIILYWFY